MKPYYQDNLVTLYHADASDILPSLPKVDLLLTDPPYGIGKDGQKRTTGGHGGRKAHEFMGWDSERPSAKLFTLMLAVSQNQIIWGGNYFADLLPPSSGWIVWDKGQRINQSDGELAWTSFDSALRIWLFNRVELLLDGTRHPTQKPKKLIARCIEFANKHTEVRTILDPFAGSGTSLKAAKDFGSHAIGVEIEESYCEIAAKRLEISQPALFIAPSQERSEQSAIFTEVSV